jgi:hypothetical protein
MNLRDNPFDSPLLVARYGRHFRLTINPPSRRRHRAAKWDAGPATDWCEVASDVMLEASRRAVEAEPDPETAEGRLDRQIRCHRLLGHLCLRPPGHWPDHEDEAS